MYYACNRMSSIKFKGNCSVGIGSRKLRTTQRPFIASCGSDATQSILAFIANYAIIVLLAAVPMFVFVVKQLSMPFETLNASALFFAYDV